jgi:hypothetical protein
MDLESGDASHSSNTRSWQRLHLLELGKIFSIVPFVLVSWATLKRASPPAMTMAKMTPPKTILSPIVLDRVTILPLLLG